MTSFRIVRDGGPGSLRYELDTNRRALAGQGEGRAQNLGRTPNVNRVRLIPDTLTVDGTVVDLTYIEGHYLDGEDVGDEYRVGVALNLDVIVEQDRVAGDWVVSPDVRVDSGVSAASTRTLARALLAAAELADQLNRSRQHDNEVPC